MNINFDLNHLIPSEKKEKEVKSVTWIVVVVVVVFFAFAFIQSFIHVGYLFSNSN